MRAAVKKFIEETIDLIEEDNWSDVAYKAESWLVDNRFIDYDMIEFWEIVREDLGIDILKFEDVEVVPSWYCWESTMTELILPEHILHISKSAFNRCRNLEKIHFPGSLISIQTTAFTRTPNLKEITYNGYKEDWNKIRLGYSAFGYTSTGKYNLKIKCKDGVVDI